MNVVIVIRGSVVDKDEAEQILTFLEAEIAAHPEKDLTVSGKTTDDLTE